MKNWWILAVLAVGGMFLISRKSQAKSLPSGGDNVGNWKTSKVYVKYVDVAKALSTKHGVPADLLLGQAAHESGLNPFAVSKVGAAGISQFMPGTARGYGLKVLPGDMKTYNGKVREYPTTKDPALDERFDPSKLMDAQARYLKQMYGSFGNWEDVLSGYLWGEAGWKKILKNPTAYTTAIKTKKVLQNPDGKWTTSYAVKILGNAKWLRDQGAF